jgi:exodeoxyribonuclease VII small subunit
LTTRTPLDNVAPQPLEAAMSDPESDNAQAGDTNAAEAAPAGDTGEADPARFDEALAQLEKLVETLEQGDLSLERSLEHFEQGIGLARECRQSLTAAEQKVQILQARDADEGDGDAGELSDFEPDADPS